MPPAPRVLLLLIGLSACATEPTIAPPPPTALRFNPEPLYRRYWAQIQTCARRLGRFDAITWYKVPGLDPFPAPGVDQPVVGYWYPPDNRIVLLEYLPDPPAVIRHEMLHALLQRTDHPALYFEERCGPTIAGPP